MRKPSLDKAHTDFKEEEAGTSTCVMLLDSKSVEDGKDRMHPKMEQTETPMVAESGNKSTRSSLSSSKMPEMITVQIARTTEKMVVEENSTLVRETLNDILQCAYKNARVVARPVNYIIMKQVLIDLPRRDVIHKTLHRHISICFKFDDAARKFCEVLLLSNSITSPIAVFVQANMAKVPKQDQLPPKWRNRWTHSFKDR